MNKYLLFAAALAVAFPAYANVEEFVNAVRDGNVAQIESYLANGENINAKNALGNTALHYAVASDDAEMVKFLLENGADANIANSKGWTPTAIAEKKDLKDIVNIFQSDKDNKALSALVAQASENITKGEGKVDEIKSDVTETLEKTAENIDKIKAKTEEKISKAEEVAENTINKSKEESINAKENIERKTQEISSIAENKIAETAKAEAKPVEQKVEAKPVEQKVKAKPVEQKVEAKPVEQKAEAKPVEQKAEAKPVVKSVAAKPVAKSVAAKPVAKSVAAKPAPKRIIKPVKTKPAPKFLASSINKSIYAGDEEIVYCLYFLGLQTEQHNLTLASEFFAGSTIMSKARFEQIADLAHTYYDNASEAEMQNLANVCSKVITPQSRDKQNQIIRAINKAIGY